MDSNGEFHRTERVIGRQRLEKLSKSHVIIFGIGGVGGAAVEALARTGIGMLTLVDGDNVEITNLNRQIIGVHSNMGKAKVQAMGERIKDINPRCQVISRKDFFLPENSYLYDFSQYNYVVDAVDTVTAKIQIILAAQTAKVPVISSMGMGNKIDATKIQVADIYETSVCPLAKVMRRELRKREVKDLKTVYSTEVPMVNKRPPGSVAFVPPVAGMMMAGEVIGDLVIRHGIIL